MGSVINAITITAIISFVCGMIAGSFRHRYISGLKISNWKKHALEMQLNREEQDCDNFQFPSDKEKESYECKKIVMRNE